LPPRGTGSVVWESEYHVGRKDAKAATKEEVTAPSIGQSLPDCKVCSAEEVRWCAYVEPGVRVRFDKKKKISIKHGC